MVDIIQETVYNSNFIPFELFMIIFIASLTIFVLSLIVKRGQIILAVISTVLMFFSTYSTFYLGSSSEPILNAGNVTIINTITTVPSLLYLLIGLTGLYVVNLWYHVANYSKDALEDAIDENKDIRKDSGI